MKIKYLFLLIGTLLSNEWVNINSSTPLSSHIDLISSNIDNTTLEFNLEGFYFDSVNINGEEYSIAKFPGSASNLEIGMPDLGHLSSSIIIPNDGSMNFEISEKEFIDFHNIKIAPSKGNLLRTINPQSVSYVFNDIYTHNQFYPDNILEMRTPYILRDMRGQTVKICPFQYNPITNVFRVYTHLKVDIYNDGIGQINVLERDSKNTLDKEFKNIYEKQFLNFNNDVRFDYLEDQGNMLVISDVSFLDTMQPLVDWKNRKGILTEMINVANIGSSSSAITSFVQDYYYENGLTFLLLVGDIAQIPSPSVSGSSSDVSYGCIEGNDFYPEIIVGRMSGSTPSQIGTQVERSIEYERYPQSGAEWYDNALGVASNQGPGFGGYTDDDFNDFLWDAVLSDFTYDSYEGIYDGSGGTDAQGINAINNGVSLINYTGHGSISSWGNGASLSSSQINALTNDNLLPFVITVGCNVGEFQSTNECFCESWMRATNNGEPTGSIAHFGSTISQSWEPPMHGQYGMNLILTESYDNHLTRSIGGITTNGCMYMNDMQGSSGINETKYWTLFGDPSTNIRTAPPSNLSVGHDDLIMIGQSEFVVDIGENGALAALSRDGALLASAYSVGGVAILELSEDASSEPGTLDLVVTGFNAFPYESSVLVMTPDGAYVSVNEVNLNSGDDNVISIGETVSISVNLENVGTDSSDDINISLTETSNSPYINIMNGNYTLDNLNAGQVATATLDFSVSENSPFGHSFSLNLEVNSESNTYATELDLNVENLLESFESSDFNNMGWELDGNAYWSIDDTYSADGFYSAKSGSIGDNTVSTIELTLEIVENGMISFSKRVSCEDVGSVSGSYYDYLSFYIDNVEQDKWAGEISWTENSYHVSEGEHTFKWSFTKDLDSSDNVDSGEDAVWIDQILFPPLFNDGGESPLTGDVNGDGEVSVLDVIIVVNMVLESDTSLAGDTNGDGNVDVLDVVNIVNIILNA